MPAYTTYVIYAIQLLLIIHVVVTGRQWFWILILLILPLIGGVAYLVMEIIPEFMGGVGGQRARRGMQQLVDPGGDERACKRAWNQSPNAENGRRYAQALINADKVEEALEILSHSRRGFFKDDPTLLFLEAQARFLNKDWQAALELLERLNQENPDFHSAEAHLLHARALEATNRIDEAVSEYREVAGYYPGAEARFRLASALKANGNAEESKAVFESLLNDAELAPAHFRRSQKVWLKASKEGLKTLP